MYRAAASDLTAADQLETIGENVEMSPLSGTKRLAGQPTPFRNNNVLRRNRKVSPWGSYPTP
ncbi:MAG TPA: hypothetical protein VF434_13720, partial [Promineifilum sp.]